jgi:hypothetical protein
MGHGLKVRLGRVQGRMVVMAATSFVLLMALWAALARLGWQVAAPATVTLQHGPLMISGFLGTLISLERAVALRLRWTYAVPAVAAAGALLLLAGVDPAIGRSAMVLAGIGLTAVFVLIYRQRPSLDSAVMSAGAWLWMIGNVFWLLGWPIFKCVPWWVGFLVLTIAGERLELSRVLRLGRTAHALLALAVGVFAAGLVLSVFSFNPGVRVAGAGLLGLGLWLFRFDVARRTIRKTGLTRFIAACLLPGYAWISLGGALWLLLADGFGGGPYYDAMLHTLLLGFVFSMIFGHEPIILPAILGVPLVYQPVFYAHLALLHLALLVRIAGDLTLMMPLQLWGGTFNVVAVLLFVGVTIWSVRRSAQAVAIKR